MKPSLFLSFSANFDVWMENRAGFSMKIRVKICCINSVEEATLAVSYGADALGEMPSGPGVISDERALEIAASVPPAVASFLLTSRQDAFSIIEQQRYVRVGTLQIVDRLTRGTFRDLRDALPGIALVQVVHVSDEESLEEALKIAPDVNAILLDSGNQRLPVKLLGGTGAFTIGRLAAASSSW